MSSPARFSPSGYARAPSMEDVYARFILGIQRSIFQATTEAIAENAIILRYASDLESSYRPSNVFFSLRQQTSIFKAATPFRISVRSHAQIPADFSFAIGWFFSYRESVIQYVEGENDGELVESVIDQRPRGAIEFFGGLIQDQSISIVIGKVFNSNILSSSIVSVSPSFPLTVCDFDLIFGGSISSGYAAAVRAHGSSSVAPATTTFSPATFYAEQIEPQNGSTFKIFTLEDHETDVFFELRPWNTSDVLIREFWTWDQRSLNIISDVAYLTSPIRLAFAYDISGEVAVPASDPGLGARVTTFEGGQCASLSVFSATLETSAQDASGLTMYESFPLAATFSFSASTSEQLEAPANVGLQADLFANDATSFPESLASASLTASFDGGAVAATTSIAEQATLPSATIDADSHSGAPHIAERRSLHAFEAVIAVEAQGAEIVDFYLLAPSFVAMATDSSDAHAFAFFFASDFSSSADASSSSAPVAVVAVAGATTTLHATTGAQLASLMLGSAETTLDAQTPAGAIAGEQIPMGRTTIQFSATIGHNVSPGALRMHAILGANDPFSATESSPVSALMNVHAARTTTLVAGASQFQRLLALIYGALDLAMTGRIAGVLAMSALAGGLAQIDGVIEGPPTASTQFAPPFDRAIVVGQSAPFPRMDAAPTLTVIQISSLSSQAPIYAPVISGELSLKATTSDDEPPLSATSPRIELLQ